MVIIANLVLISTIGVRTNKISPLSIVANLTYHCFYNPGTVVLRCLTKAQEEHGNSQLSLYAVIQPDGFDAMTVFEVLLPVFFTRHPNRNKNSGFEMM